MDRIIILVLIIPVALSSTCQYCAQVYPDPASKNEEMMKLGKTPVYKNRDLCSNARSTSCESTCADYSVNAVFKNLQTKEEVSLKIRTSECSNAVTCSSTEATLNAEFASMTSSGTISGSISIKNCSKTAVNEYSSYPSGDDKPNSSYDRYSTLLVFLAACLFVMKHLV